MARKLARLAVAAAIVIAGWQSSGAQEATKGEKPRIPGGIEGHVKRVDPEKETLTIVTEAGTERTLNLTEETTILGPRGGKVRRGLKDPRFHEGMSLTVVASGTTVREIHLGYDRRTTTAAGTRESGGTAARSPTARREPAGGTSTAAPASKARTVIRKDEAPARKPAAEEADDSDDEFPGTIRSYNAGRRLLVVTLLNGTTRSFLLPNDLKVLDRGTVSKQGLADPALKEGARVIVIMEPGGRRVKELRVNPAPPSRRTKKAG